MAFGQSGTYTKHQFDNRGVRRFFIFMAYGEKDWTLVSTPDKTYNISSDDKELYHQRDMVTDSFIELTLPEVFKVVQSKKYKGRDVWFDSTYMKQHIQDLKDGIMVQDESIDEQQLVGAINCILDESSSPVTIIVGRYYDDELQETDKYEFVRATMSFIELKDSRGNKMKFDRKTGRNIVKRGTEGSSYYKIQDLRSLNNELRYGNANGYMSHE